MTHQSKPWPLYGAGFLLAWLLVKKATSCTLLNAEYAVLACWLVLLWICCCGCV